MKITNCLPVAITALAINSGGFAFADFSQLLEHKFTIALTQSVEGEANFKENSSGYTESVKIETLKISNKELLVFLAEEGVIESITGWSIVQRTQNGNDEGIYLVKKGAEDIDISDLFEYEGDWEWDEYNYAYSESQKDTDETETYSSTEVYTDTGYFTFYFEDGEEEIVDLWADGTFTYAAKYLEIYDIGEEEETTSIYDITSLSLVDVSGKIEDFGDFAGMISGSVKTGSGKVVNID